MAHTRRDGESRTFKTHTFKHGGEIIPAKTISETYLVWNRAMTGTEEFDAMYSSSSYFDIDLTVIWDDVFGETQEAIFYLSEKRDGGRKYANSADDSSRSGDLDAYYHHIGYTTTASMALALLISCYL